MPENGSTPIEAIDFISLQNRGDNDLKPKQKLVTTKSLLWFFFLTIFACGAIVFLYLPKYVAEKQVLAPIPPQVETQKIPPPKILEPAVQKTPSLSPEELDALKLQAENLLLQVIKKQELLQQQGIKQWAAEEFMQTVALGAAGDEHFRKQNFTEAISSYERTINALRYLDVQVAPTLAHHIQQGELALTQAEHDAAVYHFELAKTIDAVNIQVLNGLKRAETIKELFALLNKGGSLEATNRLEDAKKTYQQAIDLDPLSVKAKEALNRVDNRLKDIEFAHFIAHGYASLEAQQYNDARNAFTFAQKLLPGSDKPKQGLVKVAQAIRNEKISSLTVEAEHFENNENWAYAKQSYEQILALSPHANFAKQGAARAQQRASLLSKLNDYIENKQRLNSAQVRIEASDLLQEITLLDNPGNKIKQLASSLHELLQLADQPISITLLSDNQTEVVIFKVGKFGRFEHHKLELKPGKYTIVGSRPGYRDVRKVLTVSTEMENKNIMIRCEETI